MMRVAAEAFHLKIGIAGVQGIAEGRGRLSRALKGKHALVSGFTGQPIRDPARLRRDLR